MNETRQAPPAKAKTDGSMLKLALDLGPLLVFFGVNAAFGILAATAAFMASFFAAMGVSYAIDRKIAVMPLVTGAVVLVFGGLTLYLRDETFIKLKPTIIYAIFAIVLLGGLAARRSFVRVLFGPILHLDDEGWRKLTLRWGLFFAVLAGVNEIARHTLSTDAWVAFKVWGFLPLTLMFALAQAPLIGRHTVAETPQSHPPRS